MGGLGNLSVALVLPLMGRYMDSSVSLEVIQRMSILPAVLFLCYLILLLNQNIKQRYKLEVYPTDPEELERITDSTKIAPCLPSFPDGMPLCLLESSSSGIHNGISDFSIKVSESF